MRTAQVCTMVRSRSPGERYRAAVPVRTAIASAVTAALGAPPVAGAADRRWSRRLRIVAYHRIDDVDAFTRQVALLRRRYVPVGEDRVRAALDGGEPLPERAVWVTFDDGDRTVVERGLPVLADAGVPATLYVCPGLVASGQPPWWELVLAAGRGAEVNGEHLTGPALVSVLKHRPDLERRSVVAEMTDAGIASVDPLRRPLTDSMIGRWLDAGFAIGNHTWDHPCLDRCDPEEQRRQVEAAHRWLLDLGIADPPTFAYPNGYHTDATETVLTSLGYDIALLFDHGLADTSASPLRLSRLRLDADAPARRARAVISGAHSRVLASLG